MDKKLLFALDIGTRSVVGLLGEQGDNKINLLAVERQEHYTRAMLDGQIHDVTEVAGVLAEVKSRLERIVSPLPKVAVAAAGRALSTLRVTADLDVSGRGALTASDERALELAGLQTAQRSLATADAAFDPTAYYCVGYSVVTFSLDGNPLKSLVGQRGKRAEIELIATFLPRQVIDSLQSAVQAVGLEIATLTLEPIAAINVLIPPTMRHLNLALVDVGAGTSDVAITRDGSVIGYGMVPCAGDEITEALSQQYLLDFNVAEQVKRQLGAKNKKVTFTDVLGIEHKVPAKELTASLAPAVADLAQLIARQILDLNGQPPQAVLLVGGGALTPLLPAALAQALDIPAVRVGIRRPDALDGFTAIPPMLQAPDGVTPLGILKLAGSGTLHFANISLNGQPLRLFNFGKLTVTDALLAAGIDARSLHGRPGLGITVRINGETKFFPGSHGQPGSVVINGQPAGFDHPLQDGDVITVIKGRDGATPRPRVADVAPLPQPFTVIVNGEPVTVAPLVTVNGNPADAATLLADRSEVTCRLPDTLGEVLAQLGRTAGPVHFTYTVNGHERTYRQWPRYLINGREAGPDWPVKPGDVITAPPPVPPTLAQLLGLAGLTDEFITVTFNGEPCQVPLRRLTLTLNGRPADPGETAPTGSEIEFSLSEQPPTVSDVLLAAAFNPRALRNVIRIDLLLNGQAAEYTTPVKKGDRIDVIAITETK